MLRDIKFQKDWSEVKHHSNGKKIKSERQGLGETIHHQSDKTIFSLTLIGLKLMTDSFSVLLSAPVVCGRLVAQAR